MSLSHHQFTIENIIVELQWVFLKISVIDLLVLNEVAFVPAKIYSEFAIFTQLLSILLEQSVVSNYGYIFARYIRFDTSVVPFINLFIEDIPIHGSTVQLKHLLSLFLFFLHLSYLVIKLLIKELVLFHCLGFSTLLLFFLNWLSISLSFGSESLEVSCRFFLNCVKLLLKIKTYLLHSFLLWKRKRLLWDKFRVVRLENCLHSFVLFFFGGKSLLIDFRSL